MTSTFTTNLALNLQATGDNPNAWGTVLNSGVFTVVDQALGTKLSLSVAGSADVTLTTSQSQNLYFNFTGVLTGNINVIYPASAGRLIIVNNATTGSFTLTVKPSGGTGLLIPQGAKELVQIDGTSNIALNAANSPVLFETTVASAATTDLASGGSNLVSITGVVTITSFGSNASTTNALYFIRFTGALTLTHNATSLILPGAANITTTAGDTAIMKYEGSGNWRCIDYQFTSAPRITTIGTNLSLTSGTLSAVPAYGSIYGCYATAISGTNTTAAVTVGSGQAIDSSNTSYITCAGYSWAVSNGNAINGYSGGTTLPNSSTIHFFLCTGGSGTGTFASTSLTPTFPTGYTTYTRRIFSIITNSSGAPLAGTYFEMEGGGLRFEFSGNAPFDINATNPGTSAVNVAVSVPSGIYTVAIMNVGMNDGTGTGAVMFRSQYQADQAAATSASPLATFNFGSSGQISLQGLVYIQTTTAAGITYRANYTNATSAVYGATIGWIDYRRG